MVWPVPAVAVPVPEPVVVPLALPVVGVPVPIVVVPVPEPGVVPVPEAVVAMPVPAPAVPVPLHATATATAGAELPPPSSPHAASVKTDISATKKIALRKVGKTGSWVGKAAIGPYKISPWIRHARRARPQAG